MTANSDNASFAAMSKDVVRRFLQSVVVLDDLASLGEEEPIEDVITMVKLPDYGSGASIATARPPALGSSPAPASENVNSEDTDSTQEPYKERGLFAKPLIDAFAKLGLVCAVLRSSQTDLEKEGIGGSSVVKAAKRADIVVLDWKLGDSYGRDTIEIIRHIIKEDGGDPRLRLFSIYTGESGLHEIFRQVTAALEEFYDGHRLQECGEYSVAKGPALIAVIPKQGTWTVGATPVSEVDLPERLIDEFAALTKGILRNVALEGLSALRDDVPRVLAKFHPDLDPAYLGHRMLLPNPADAEDHVVDALGAELLSILEHRRPGDKASIGAIRAWLDEAWKAGNIDPQSLVRISSLTCPVDMRIELVEKGIDIVENTDPSKGKLKESSTSRFSRDADSAKKSDLDFAVLLGLKTHYSTKPPRLTLGTVIRERPDGGDWGYFMCLQPKCDSVRLKGTTGFPFLRLSISDDRKRFGCVIYLPEGEWIYLDVDETPGNLQVVSFLPNSGVGGEVFAAKDCEGFCFSDVNEKEYQWVAAFKDEQALQVADKVAKRMARPGPNQSEWLRRASERNVKS